MTTNEVIEVPAPVRDELVSFLSDIQEYMNWHYELESLFLVPSQKFQADIMKEWNEV
jgi:hypothetical protein